MKDQQNYKLSSSFKSIHQARKNQTQSYIQNLQGETDPQKLAKVSRKKSRDHHHQKAHFNHPALYKLNPTSTAMVSEVPIETIRIRSRNKLESLNDPINDNSAQKFSIFNHQKLLSSQNMVKKDKKEFLKKYNIDVGVAFDAELKKHIDGRQMEEQEQQNQGYLKPSQFYEVPACDTFSEHTVFQTPLLPCFSSQFTPNNLAMLSDAQVSFVPDCKEIKQGQGVWKIGKIKIKGKKAIMKIGSIDFDGELISAEGKSATVSGDTMYQLQDWKGLWILQPKDDIFL